MSGLDIRLRLGVSGRAVIPMDDHLLRDAMTEPSMDNEPAILDRLAPTATSAQLWRAVTGLFLAVGLIALANALWIVSADLYARQSWPRVPGQIMSISEKSSAGTARASRRTRYWVEYGVGFVVPPARCKTGVTEGSDGALAVCVGTVRTRSTQSASTAGTWMRDGVRDTSVQVLYDPNGPGIKIVGESLWLRYPWDSIAVTVVWVVVFGVGFSIARRRLHVLKRDQHDAGV